MSIVDVVCDVDALTLRVTADFAVEPERVWDVWRDPRKIERWWGPPTYPATFVRHDFTPGGESRYYMTGPGGDVSRGWWRIISLDEPRRIDFLNGLAGEDGEPTPDFEPMPSYVTFESISGGTRMVGVTNYVSLESMQRMLDMGMRDGMCQAIDQIDALLV